MVVLADVLDVEGDELAAPQGAGKAEEEQGTVPDVETPITERGNDSGDDLRAGGPYLLRGQTKYGGKRQWADGRLGFLPASFTAGCRLVAVR